jgi:SAM-dependent methyltransferase
VSAAINNGGDAMSSELTDLDATNRAPWAPDDDDANAELSWEVGGVVAGAVPIAAGMSVLDVATGAGSVAIHAAQAGAQVTGLAIAAEQLEGARRRADAAGVQVEWVDGDLEALPYDDDSFDRVLSAFGPGFAGQPDVAASELVRVCRPGGEVVMANWCPEGFGGRLAATLHSHRHAPQSDGPVALGEWGTHGHVRRRLGGQLVLAIEPGSVDLVFASVDAMLAHHEAHLGPLVAAKAELEPQRYEALRDELRALMEELDVGEGETRIVAPYLLVVGHKPRDQT